MHYVSGDYRVNTATPLQASRKVHRTSASYANSNLRSAQNVLDQ